VGHSRRSVRKSEDRLRITAQLNRVSDGYHMWSRTCDRQLRDVFAVQKEISDAIANELRRGQLSKQPPHEPTKDMEAYRLYQEGRYFFNKFEPPDSDLKAIARDPNFAAAYAGIADAYSYLAENFVVAPREVMPKAKQAAMKALDLDDSSAEAHTSLGIVKLDYERDRDGGQREIPVSDGRATGTRIRWNRRTEWRTRCGKCGPHSTWTRCPFPLTGTSRGS
jgi:adenylate cyclase